MSELRDAAERVERALREHPLSWHVDVDAYDVQLLVEHALAQGEVTRSELRDSIKSALQDAGIEGATPPDTFEA